MADYSINPDNIPAPSEDIDISPFGRRNQSILGGYVGRLIAGIPAAPTGLYTLANMGTEYLGLGTLPGAEGAREITEGIINNADAWGSKLAGEELDPGLLSNNTWANKIGTAIDVMGTALPVTGGPVMKMYQALKNVDTGSKAVNKTVSIATEAASYFSPLIPTKNPKTVLAVGAGLGGGTTVAVDLMTPPKTDPEIDQEIELFKQRWGAVNTQLNEAANAGTDQAIDGIGASFDAKSDLAMQQAIANFKAADWSNPIEVEDKKARVIAAGVPELGDYKGAALGVISLAGIAAFAYHKRAALNEKILLPFFGGKEYGKAAKGDFITKPDATNLPARDVFAAEVADASIPAKRESLNPEIMGINFEKATNAYDIQSQRLRIDGKLADSSTTLMRPLDDYVRDVVKLSEVPADLQLFREGANFASESNNRLNSWLAKVHPKAAGKISADDPVAISSYEKWLAAEKAHAKSGISPDDIEAKHAFHTADASGKVASFADIRAKYTAAMAHPTVGPLLREHADITKKIGLDYRLEQGLMPKGEYTRLLNAHPTFYPVRIDKPHMSSLDLSSRGGRLEPGDIVKELFPFIRETVTDVAHQKAVRVAIMELRDRAAKGDVRASELIGRDAPFNMNGYISDKMVAYRNWKGEARMIEVRDPTYRRSMQAGAGTAALRLNEGAIKVIAFPSRMLEAATTGPLSVIPGTAFAPLNFMYGTGFSIINRPAGTVAGGIDRLVQNAGIFGKNAAGINRGFRGDPTHFALAAGEILPSVVAVLSKNIARSMEASVRNNGWIASAVGPATVDAWAKSMSNYYKSTMIATMESHALRGGATPMTRNVVTTMDDLEASLSKVNLPVNVYKNVRDFVHDILGAVGNAPQVSFFRQNKGRMSEDLLVHHTRNIMGDPSKSGLGNSSVGKSIIQGSILAPWGGVTLQSFSRFAHSIRTNPSGTAMAIFNGVAMPTILATDWNARIPDYVDPATGKSHSYVDYQYNVRTPEQVSSGIYVAIPGLPPEQGLEIRLDQLIRPFKVMTDIIYGTQMGLQDGSIFKPENIDQLKMYQDNAATRYGLTGDAMKAAFSQVIPAVPTAVNALLGLAGADVQFRSYMDTPQRVVENKAAGATDSTARYTDAKFFGYDISARTEAMFNNLGGQIGRAILGAIESGDRAPKDGLTRSDYISDAGDRWMMNLGQATREVSGLWGHSATISPSQEASSKALQEQMEGLKKLDAASKKLRSLSGAGDSMVGAKGREIDTLAGTGPVQFKDEQMYALGFDAQRFLAIYNRKYAGTIGDLYQQRASIMSSEKVSPQVKQTLVNDVSKKIVETNRAALSAVQQWQWNTSKAYGKNIDLRKIQLDLPITQFKSLLD